MFGSRSQCRERGVEAGRVEVVEQQPHPHAAPGRIRQRFEQQVADLVAMPDVVLGIERALGGVRQQHAGGERVAGVGQRVDAALAGMDRRLCARCALPRRVSAVSRNAVDA